MAVRRLRLGVRAGQPLLNALLFELAEPTVLAWRIGRALTDAGVAVLVWWLVREQGAGERWALAGGAATALTMAQPTTANPFPVALLCALAALACAARGRAVPAGLLVALAGFWRPDFGVAAAVAVIAALALRGAGRRGVVRAVAVAAGAIVVLPRRSRSPPARATSSARSSSTPPATARPGGSRSPSSTTARSSPATCSATARTCSTLRAPPDRRHRPRAGDRRDPAGTVAPASA